MSELLKKKVSTVRQMLSTIMLFGDKDCRACAQYASLALDAAHAAHCGTRKDGKTPEFLHQMEIALLVCNLPDFTPKEILFLITGAIVHDFKEDYPMKYDEFNHNVEVSTDGETYLLTGRDFPLRIERLSELMDKNEHDCTQEYYDSLAKDPILAAIKGADRIHNLGTMQGVFTQEKIEQYIAETEKYVLPMLKKARHAFPQYQRAYELLKFYINQQLNFFKKGLHIE
jgi:(p)ppGpp synthase/HD superfamily hydrolase